jgi:hypothetical protein
MALPPHCDDWWMNNFDPPDPFSGTQAMLWTRSP